MGRSGLSSKRKHSKKKSLKVSSEARRKKKSRRNKSKKLRHHDDSFSSYSDDESTSSSLVSSSSSEGEYRSKRSRSHARDEVKGSRKRSRKRSSSEESIRDSPPVKKRKESKKKKKSKKKKARRDAYSSDSASCSTCRDGDSSSDEGGRFREKKRNHRDSIKGRKGHRKNRSRPRSSSPSKLSNSYDDDSIEKVVVENNSRRLKSVITVAIQPDEEEGNDTNKDELKEEIVYDHDDYPSSKSNDSNDGENKKELLDYVDSKEKDSNDSGNIASETDNLESILRQKALENLSRFRGGHNQGGVKQLPTKSVNLVQTQSKPPVLEPDGSSMMAVPPQPVVQRSRFTWRRDPSVATRKEEKEAPAPKLQSGNLSSTSRVVNKNAQKSTTDAQKATIDVRKSTTDAQKETIDARKSTSDAQKATIDVRKLSSDAQKSTSDAQKSTIDSQNPTIDSQKSISDAQKSTTVLETPTEEGSSKEQQSETKDNSQFEQKTMSVMRGGEMVQVSYKVYIPKKAPALARRQLKR